MNSYSYHQTGVYYTTACTPARISLVRQGAGAGGKGAHMQKVQMLKYYPYTFQHASFVTQEVGGIVK